MEDRDLFKSGMYSRLEALPFVNGVRRIHGPSASNASRFFEAWEYETPQPHRYLFIGCFNRGPDLCEARDIDDDVVWSDTPPDAP